MSTEPQATTTSGGDEPRPLLAVGRDELHLSSDGTAVARGTIPVTNTGNATLDGAVVVRVGREWLRAEPGMLRLAPGEKREVEVQADPATLEPGYTLGELGISSGGGTATVAVRLAIGARRNWGVFIGAIAASVAVTVAVGVLLSGVKLPASPPSPTAAAGKDVSAPPNGRTARGQQPLSTVPAFDRAAALSAIRRATLDSDRYWRAALTQPSLAQLGTVKTGADLALVSGEARDLLSSGDRWRITTRRPAIADVSVADDGQSGTCALVKTENRALYAPGQAAPLDRSSAVYHLHYHLVHQAGRWLVDEVTVVALQPLASAPALPLVQDVARQVLPVVMHVETISGDGPDVGTGIVIRSSSTSSDIITNDHVVHGYQTVRVRRWVGHSYQAAVSVSRVWEDQADDLAVLRIDQGGLPVAVWGDSDGLQPGQQVVAIGYGEDLVGGPGIAPGVVSSVLRTVPGDSSGATYIGHNATINPGNSGGPLVDMSGHVVGINTLTLDGTQGLFFAIPSSRAARVAVGYIGSNG